MAKTQKPNQENEGVEAPQPRRFEDYEETILVRNPYSGEVNAVSALKQNGNRYEVHTTQPLTKNAPGFFEIKDSGAVAAFIRSFKSQKDNAVDFQFLKVPFNAVQDAIAGLMKLTQNPNDEEGVKVLGKYYLDTAKLERVKFDHNEIPRAELKELGIDFDALTPRTQEQLRMGLPVGELVPATVQVSPNVTTTGLFAPRFYRDHNDALKVALDTALPRPEFENEQYQKLFSTQEKATMAQGGTLERLVLHKDAATGREEWCFVGFNAATNRLVFQPKREVETPGFTYRARIPDEGRRELENGGSALVEGCHYGNSDNNFSGKIAYDIHRGEYVTTPIKFDRPYVTKGIREQVSEKELKALHNYEPIAGDNIKSSNGKYYKGCILQINKQTNMLMYLRSPKQSQDQTQTQAQHTAQQQENASAKQSRGIKR